MAECSKCTGFIPMVEHLYQCDNCGKIFCNRCVGWVDSITSLATSIAIPFRTPKAHCPLCGQKTKLKPLERGGI